ncbi:ricin-type beta-trefoil lectin domain protein [Streptomyces sp. NPDC089919]|uniref:ricin-type beta-trefoil lectin domain protein n=1 Tax=Streptomyces sp. NPDC089919 TaxID=3155188 RepID=UPI0034160376
MAEYRRRSSRLWRWILRTARGRWTVAALLTALLVPLGALAGPDGRPLLGGPLFEGLFGGNSADGAFLHDGGYRFEGKNWRPVKLPTTPAVGSHTLKPAAFSHPKGYRPLRPYTAVAPKWPKAATTVVALPKGAGKPVKAPGTPVWIAPGRTAPKAVRVQVAPHAAAGRAGVNGMLLALRPQGATAGAGVRLVVDYAAIQQAFGGGYGSRLSLVTLPECALTTPELASCRTKTPLKTENRVGAAQLSASVAMATAETTTVGVTSDTGGSQGDFGATSLSASGTWQASGTGSYTYSYPIDVPAALGGSAPSVGLNYDSQAVDGETSARNSQGSWIGDGWSYAPGFVERSYRACTTFLDGNGDKILKGSGDKCWSGANAIVSFGSHNGVLIPDTKDPGVPNLLRQWKLRGDDGTVVQELSGAVNGLQDGTYFRVLTMDGTAAYFGAQHAPTAAGTAGAMDAAPTDTSTKSAWGVPVLHPRSGDPCYDSAKGKASRCAKPEGWRWNLDFVVTQNGFVQRYDYSTESNYYDLGGGQAAAGADGTLVSYTRGGALSLISYGYTLADARASRAPAAQVDFATVQRCQTDATFTDCSAGNLKDATSPHWPDTPWDLHCDSTDTTHLPTGSQTIPANVCITYSPTFWSTTRLDSITTKVNVKATGQLTAVDTYKLRQIYSDAGGTVDPVTGTSVDPAHHGVLQAVQWLQSVKHTGKDTYGNGNTDLALNQVSFTGTEIDNRVNDVEPSAPPLYHPRISSVQTETGESIAVEYNSAPCAGKTLDIAQADANTESCYPVYWAPPGASKPVADWFNKVTVHQVTVSDLTVAGQYQPDQRKIPAGSEPQVSTYAYAGAAWHRDDSELSNDLYRTWDRFRGFRTVTVQTGRAPEPVTQSVTTYLQGMDGDYKKDGTRRSVTRTAQVGGQTVQTITDADQLAGIALQTDTYTKAGGTITATSVNGPFTFTTTATHPQTPWTDWTQTEYPGDPKPALSTLPDVLARRLKTTQVHGYALLADGTWRHTRQDSTYDTEGRISSIDSYGDVSVPAQRKCATTAYATPPAGNTAMLSYPKQLTTYSGDCANAPTPTTTLTDRQIYYNGDGTLTNLGAFGTVSATGKSTGVRIATGFTGTTENWRTTTALKYDGASRATDSTDATGQSTHTDFTPAWSAAGGNTNPTGLTTTNSKSWTTSSVFGPLRGLPTQTVDANGRKTEITYDALGRRTAVWMPGRDKGAGESADMTYAYSINPGAVPAPGDTVTQPGAPSAVTTKSLREDGTYATSITIYDGMLQPRQTQVSAMGDSNSGRVISDRFYDSHGWPLAAYQAYSEPSSLPSTTLYAANENEVPAESTTEYDGQGRSVKQTLWHQAVEQWHSSTDYPGADEVDSTAPGGGRTEAVFTDAGGRTTSSVVKNSGTTVKLLRGDGIPSGSSVTSASVRLAMQADGNLVLSSLTTGKSLWSTGTTGNSGAYAKFGTDGNLAVFSTAGAQLWTSGLAASTGLTLEVRNDADLTILGSSGAAAWSSATAGRAAVADATTRYGYDAWGRTTSVKDTAGNTWSYTYDFLGQALTATDPNTGTTTYDKYDVAGNLLQTTDARGQTVSYTYDWNNRRTASYGAAWSATPDPAKQLSGWAYDTLAKGFLTSSTRYVTGASGKAYTSAVTGYNTEGQPTGSSLTIPASDGFAAPGQAAPPASGTVTYTTSARYTPTNGMLSTVHYGADGNLPAEDIDYGYTQQGNLDTVGGYITAANTPAYLSTAVHDAFGRVLQANYGPAGKQLATFTQFDGTTGRVSQASSMTQTSATALDVVKYRYNASGEVTAVDDLRDNTTHDTQCFTYDSFQRLASAWTDTAGITDPTAAVPGALGGCTNKRVQNTSQLGGPAPYWQDYTFNLLGDRTGFVNHDVTGNALNNTTQSIPYTGTDAGLAATLPNQAGAAKNTGPTGTATTTPTYTDPAYANKNAGRTMTRKVTATGPLSTGFTLTGGGKKCIEDAGGSTTPGTKVQIATCSGSSTAQKWTVGTDGTVKVLGLCLDTTANATVAGTLVVIDTCSTDTTQKWKVTTTGTLVSNANSALCLTDPAASATNGTQLTLATCGSSGQVWTSAATANGPVPAGQTQTLTYDTEGRTQSVATGNGTGSNTSKYLYDADGGLLIQTAAVNGVDKKRVLYLFGGSEQITLDVTAKTFTGRRYLKGPDGTVVTRSSTGAVSYQLGDAAGTATTSVDATTLAVTRRSFDPYGNSRGAKPATWVGADENHGFLGQPADPVTGLNLLGARNYDPLTGRFLTPDPIFQAGDPNQMGGYSYAADNPASSADPTGFDDWYNDPSMNTCVIDCNKAPEVSTTTPNTSVTSSGNTVTVNGYTVKGIHNTQKFMDKYVQELEGYFKQGGGYGIESPNQMMADIASALMGACWDDKTCNNSQATRSFLYDIYCMNEEFVFGWDGAMGAGAEVKPKVSSAEAAKAAELDAAKSRAGTAGDTAKEAAAGDGRGTQEKTTAEEAAKPATKPSEPAAGAEGTKAAPAPKAIEPAPVRKALTAGPTRKALPAAPSRPALTQSPMAEAQGWQGSESYPGIDSYRSITLREGDTLYGGYPGPGAYLTTPDGFALAGGDATAYYQGVQVGAWKGTYRQFMREYTVTQNTQAAYGITEANPQYGAGGLPQVYLPNWQQVLSPVRDHPMKNWGGAE